MENLLEVKITEGLLSAGLVQCLLLNTECIKKDIPGNGADPPEIAFYLAHPKKYFPVSVCPTNPLQYPLKSKSTSLCFGLVPLGPPYPLPI